MGKRQRRRLREGLSTRHSSAPTERARSGEAPPGAHLRRLVDQRKALDAEIDAEIERLRLADAGWPAIARALQVTRQAARQHWFRSTSAGRASVAPTLKA